jgi:HSP20 family protein
MAEKQEAVDLVLFGARIMALIRWEPFREVESMQRQMNRLFDQMMSYGNSQIESGQTDGISFMPAAEIHETENEVKLRVEVPGVEAKDLDVNVSAEAVAIRGERRSEAKQENGGIHRSEFRYGSF